MNRCVVLEFCEARTKYNYVKYNVMHLFFSSCQNQILIMQEKLNIIQYPETSNEFCFWVIDKTERLQFMSSTGKTDEQTYPILTHYRKKTDSGVYLFFEDTTNGSILPLYVGRSNTLYIRMHQHFNEKTPFMKKYNDFHSDFVCNPKTQHPFVGLQVSFLLIQDEKERQLKERELIHAMQPMFNVH